MNKLIIKRSSGFSGSLSKMICYIDSTEICRIKENETFKYETEKTICEFTCQLTLGNHRSDEYLINFGRSEIITITVSQGNFKPQVIVNFGEGELTNGYLDEEKVLESATEFNPTKRIGNYIYIDEARKEWAIPTSFLLRIKKVYKYSDIISFDLLEDGNSISSGGLGRAAVGGLLFGGVGAIVGAATGKHKTKSTCYKLQVKISVKDTSKPAEFITLLSSEAKRNSFLYKLAFKNAQQIMSMLEIMCNQNKTDQNTIKQLNEDKHYDISNQIGGAEEILKYKELMDKGIISQEEFEKKKNQILGL